MHKCLNNPIVLVFLVALFWGLNFPISKIALKHMDPYTIRILACVLSLAVYMAFVYPVRKSLPHISASTYFTLFLLSIPIAGVVPLFNLMALSYIDSSVAVILLYTMPAINTVLQGVINKYISRRQFYKIFFCLMGVWFTLSGSLSIGTGEVIILLGAFCWAVGGILNDRYAPKIDARISASIQLSFATILTFLLFFIWYFWQSGYFIDWQGLKYLGVSFWFAVWYVGMIGGGLAFICWFMLMKNYGSDYASYALMLIPAIGVFSSLYITQDAFSVSVIIGLVCMIVSVAFNKHQDKKNI